MYVLGIFSSYNKKSVNRFGKLSLLFTFVLIKATTTGSHAKLVPNKYLLNKYVIVIRLICKKCKGFVLCLCFTTRHESPLRVKRVLPWHTTLANCFFSLHTSRATCETFLENSSLASFLAMIFFLHVISI